MAGIADTDLFQQCTVDTHLHTSKGKIKTKYVGASHLTTTKCQRRWCDWAHTPLLPLQGAGFASHTLWDFQKAANWGF